MSTNMKKILIVDDSLVYRHALTSALSEEKDLEIVGSAKNGQEALDFIIKRNVDLITLDIEMPVMDGFQLISKLKLLPSRPKIIVFTSLDASGAGNALKALQLGANDFVTKVVGNGNINDSINEIKELLIPKIKSLLKVSSLDNLLRNEPSSASKVGASLHENTIRNLKPKYNFIFIGCSTGGPEALRLIFNNLRGDIMPPIFIVQHMPPIYTMYLAKALCENTSYNVIEAKHGDIVKSGMCYIAPGDFHLSVVSHGLLEMRICLSQEEKECFVRPSVNYLFRSAKNLIDKSLFIILTGMGNDGLQSVNDLINSGAKPDVLIQDEASSVVWGMPGEIFNKKLHSSILSLSMIKDSLLKII